MQLPLKAMFAAAIVLYCASVHAGDPAQIADDLATASVTATPQSTPLRGLDQEVALRASLAAVGQHSSDYTLLDQDGKRVSLSKFRGKPLLVNFIYTGCYRICPTSSRALRKAVNAMRGRFGADQFNVVSIGFNQPTDSPTALREFAAQQSISDTNWAFLSPNAADVAGLARSFGFSFVPTPMGFDHTLQVSIVDAQGVIRQQVLGDAFGPDSLGEPLKQLLGGSLVSAGTSFTDLLAKVRILCSVYDPETGEYRVDYSLYLEIAGGLTFIMAVFGFALQEWRGHRARRRLQRR